MEEQKTPGMRIRALREMKFQSIRNLAEQAWAASRLAP